MNKNIPHIVLFLLLSISCFGQVDTTIGLTAPKGACKDYKDLTHYLCDGLTGDKDKANAIYNWITHNIKYDVKALEKGNVKQPDADRVLKNRRALCGGYALLFTDMCKEAGMKSVTIDGYGKDWMFDNGDTLYLPRHGWSAVRINGKWQLADPTWGAGGLVPVQSWLRKMLQKVMKNKVAYSKHRKFKFEYDPKFFMQDPEVFRLKHLPADPMWQLTDTVMPIQVFETGDSAVMAFNTKYSKPKQTGPELTRISNLPEEQRNFEEADRAYAYNKNYMVALAVKNIYKASSEVEKASTDSTVKNPKLLVTDAKNNLKKSQDYIKDQKKVFPGQYSRLKKKNRAKNQEGMQYIRQIKSDDKTLMSKAKKYGKTTTPKGNKVKKKYALAAKRRQNTDPQKVESIEGTKLQKKKDSPDIRALDDSIASRATQIAGLHDLATVQKRKIKALEAENDTRLDTLAAKLQVGDSLLVLETLSRLGMHDSYDDEVMALSGRFKEVKYKQSDTLQKYYLAGYDTLVAWNDNLEKIQTQEMDVYKKNMRTLEQYKKWNNSNTDVDIQYKEWANNYLSCIDTFSNDLAVYSGYLKRNKKLFGALEKENKQQIKLTEYMAQAEQLRSKVEKKELSARQAFDMHENDKQIQMVKKMEKKMDEFED